MVQAILFGAIHYANRGLLKALVTMAVGLALGGFYLAFGRCLWPLILAHGLINTMGFLEEYLDGPSA